MLRLPAVCARRAALALLAGAAALPGATAQVACLDSETLYGTNVTHLDFQNSSFTTNTLHLEGGELVYENIGIVRNRAADLTITDIGGNYRNIKESWDLRNLDPADMNGKRGKMGKINLITVRGVGDSGNANFRFCIVDAETREPVTVEKFVFTMYDIDQREADNNGNQPVLERAFFDGSNAGAIQMVAETEINLGCEDNSMPPCAPGVRTRFHSTTQGDGSDNPTDPNDLTESQIRKSVAITFVDTSCWDFEYNIYCPADQPGYEGSPNDRCSGRFRAGGNLIFAGTSERLVLEGVCLPSSPFTYEPSLISSLEPSDTPSLEPSFNPSHNPSLEPSLKPTNAPSLEPSLAPSLKPSLAPSLKPSLAPSIAPSLAPSIAPSLAPSLKPSHGPSVDTRPSCIRVDCCFNCFCCGPGTSWNSVTGTCMADSESSTGDDDSSCGQADINACYTDSVCVGEECCGGGTSLDVDPDFDLGDRCLCYGDTVG